MSFDTSSRNVSEVWICVTTTLVGAQMGCVIPHAAPHVPLPSPALVVGTCSPAGFYFGDYPVHDSSGTVASAFSFEQNAFVTIQAVWCIRSSSLFLLNSIPLYGWPSVTIHSMRESGVVSSFLMILSRAAGNMCV